MRAACLPCTAVAACLAWCALAGSHAWAASGGQVSLPLANQPATKGLRLALDFQWADCYGYRPVRLAVTCQPAAAADRTLRVELTLSRWVMDERAVSVVTDVEIPAGSTNVSHVIPVPQVALAELFALRVWEDGAQIDELSTDRQPLGGGIAWSAARILFVGKAPADVSGFRFLDTQYNQVYAPHAASVSAFDQRSPDQLVPGWINYSGLDLVFVRLGDASDLAAKRPEVWRALTQWGRAGGNLCVYGAGRDFAGLEELERLVGLPAGAPDKKHRGWETPSTLVFDSQVVPEAAMYQQNSLAAAGATVPQAPAGAAPQAPKDPPFAWRPAALGMVVALAEDQPFPGDQLTWRWLLASLEPRHTNWHFRYGTVPGAPNPQFNDFLIADVGLPPIRAYRVLITLFVVAIGPLNYWLLRRKGRLHLFLFTVPLAALLTSGALFAWALVNDGLTSRLRARSLTCLDQSTGEAVRLARLSYYTGLAPAAGLRFSGETAIFPLELSAEGGRNRQMEWAGEQYLTRGWLGSRTPTQYVTARAHRTAQRLVPIAGASGTAVENQLGVDIHNLLWCDADGKLYHGHSIAAGAVAPLALVADGPKSDQLLLAISRAVGAHPPAYPAAMSAYDTRSNWLFPVRRGRYNYYTSQPGGVDTSQSLLERELASIKTAIVSRALEPGSYVAVVDRPAEVETGLDGLSESESLHVIRGRWRSVP